MSARRLPLVDIKARPPVGIYFALFPPRLVSLAYMGGEVWIGDPEVADGHFYSLWTVGALYGPLTPRDLE